MSSFQILCVTMHQTNFSKIGQMNIHSDVIFANQANDTRWDEMQFENHTARMITTNTRGVGLNRNLALMYADADICLLADDDIIYVDGVETLVMDEFKKHPEADVMIFNVDTLGGRKQRFNPNTKKCKFYSRMPYATFSIAIRVYSVRAKNIMFTSLFGGGCMYGSGEDSMFLADMRRKGLKLYVSSQKIGMVDMSQSTWYSGANQKFYYDKGAYYRASHPLTLWLWMGYFAFRTRGSGELSIYEKLKWMFRGGKGYNAVITYGQYVSGQGT